MDDRGPVLAYQDEHLLVIDKPSGMPTAPLSAGEPGTLLAWVIARFPQVDRLPGRKPIEPGLLHRLDSGTSGLVLVALNAEAFARLRGLFEAGEVEKSYLALCRPPEGASAGQTLTIESRFRPWGPRQSKVKVVLSDEESRRGNGLATRASYRTDAVVERAGPKAALVRARLRKGFRHQVRAHLSHLGFPIYGDPLYGVPVPGGAVDRLYLHAQSLAFLHPITGTLLQVEAPLPETFFRLLD